MELTNKLGLDFSNIEKSLNGKSQSSANLARKDAFEHFQKLGFPTSKDEEWKYTDLRELLSHSFSETTQGANISKETIDSFFIPALKANNLVFINGKFRRELSSIFSSEKELLISDLKEADVLSNNLKFGLFSKYNQDGLISLNEAFSQDGIFIEVPKNAVLTVPTAFYFISDTSTRDAVSFPRVVIQCHENSHSQWIENIVKVGARLSFSNAITEFVVEENAHVSYFKIENEGDNSYHVGTTQVNQVGKSVFHSVTVALSGNVVRNNLNILIQKEYSESNLFGLTLLNAASHVDNHTVVDHAVANCESKELYKAVLDEQSSSVFNGKIFVRQDAQKTNAYQSSKNILLSNDCSAYSKPQLEIWADDVKCSHGHATGQLDKDALFYLKARGIGDKDAKAMLTQAYVQDILNAISIEPLKKFCENLVNSRF